MAKTEILETVAKQEGLEVVYITPTNYTREDFELTKTPFKNIAFGGTFFRNNRRWVKILPCGVWLQNTELVEGKGLWKLPNCLSAQPEGNLVGYLGDEELVEA